MRHQLMFLYNYYQRGIKEEHKIRLLMNTLMLKDLSEIVKRNLTFLTAS